MEYKFCPRKMARIPEKECMKCELEPEECAMEKSTILGRYDGRRTE